MTGRISSNGYTILSDMDKPMSFERALKFNQNMFYALIRRGFIKLAISNETFSRTKDGDTLVDLYDHSNPEDLNVKHNTPTREQRVTDRLAGKTNKKKPVKQAKKPVTASAAA